VTGDEVVVGFDRERLEKLAEVEGRDG
jgi:hypothetical protein